MTLSIKDVVSKNSDQGQISVIPAKTGIHNIGQHLLGNDFYSKIPSVQELFSRIPDEFVMVASTILWGNLLPVAWHLAGRAASRLLEPRIRIGEMNAVTHIAPHKLHPFTRDNTKNGVQIYRTLRHLENDVGVNFNTKRGLGVSSLDDPRATAEEDLIPRSVPVQVHVERNEDGSIKYRRVSIASHIFRTKAPAIYSTLPPEEQVANQKIVTNFVVRYYFTEKGNLLRVEVVERERTLWDGDSLRIMAGEKIARRSVLKTSERVFVVWTAEGSTVKQILESFSEVPWTRLLPRNQRRELALRIITAWRQLPEDTRISQTTGKGLSGDSSMPPPVWIRSWLRDAPGMFIQETRQHARHVRNRGRARKNTFMEALRKAPKEFFKRGGR